jgi:hypothetical protein
MTCKSSGRRGGTTFQCVRARWNRHSRPKHAWTFLEKHLEPPQVGIWDRNHASTVTPFLFLSLVQPIMFPLPVPFSCFDFAQCPSSRYCATHIPRSQSIMYIAPAFISALAHSPLPLPSCPELFLFPRLLPIPMLLPPSAIPQDTCTCRANSAMLSKASPIDD